MLGAPVISTVSVLASPSVVFPLTVRLPVVVWLPDNETAPAKVTDWSVPIVKAVVGVAPVWNTNVPVVSATTWYAVVLVVDDLIVLI